MTLDRKTAPAAAPTFRAGATAWTRSTGRPFDSFVGVLSIPANDAYMYPAFYLADGDPTSCVAGMEGATPEPCATIRAHYGGDALIVEPIMGNFDGIFHREACRKAGVPEGDALGWAIFGNRNPGVECEIRFVSGRNLGKFTPRTPRVGETVAQAEARWELKESRDLPKAWAVWLVAAIRNQLGLPHGAFQTVNSVSGKLSKAYVVTIP